MSLAKREAAIKEFKEKPDVHVMLMSLKSAALGLNLTCANHVVLFDLWWNPTIEEQAIDRAHRIGQTRNVKVGETRISLCCVQKMSFPLDLHVWQNPSIPGFSYLTGLILIDIMFVQHTYFVPAHQGLRCLCASFAGNSVDGEG